jgi:hypothetical protein
MDIGELNRKIILDSEFLRDNFEPGDNLEEISCLVNLDLLRRLYSEECKFTESELVNLVLNLDYLMSGKLKTVSFFLKFHFPSSEYGEVVTKCLNEIKFESNNICIAAIEAGGK